MNIITGSSGGLGRELFKLFSNNNLPIFGIDIESSNSTSLELDLSNKAKVIEELSKIDQKIDSITFTHAIGNSKEEVDTFSFEDYRFVNAESNLEIISLLKNKLSSDSSIVFISSVHSVLTNHQSNNYALSKNYLEGIYKMICLDTEQYKFKKAMLRLGAMDTSMLKKNVSNLDELANSLPSGKVLEPKKIAEFIFDIHTKYSSEFNSSILQIDGGVLFKLATD